MKHIMKKTLSLLIVAMMLLTNVSLADLADEAPVTGDASFGEEIVVASPQIDPVVAELDEVLLSDPDEDAFAAEQAGEPLDIPSEDQAGDFDAAILFDDPDPAQPVDGPQPAGSEGPIGEAGSADPEGSADDEAPSVVAGAVSGEEPSDDGEAGDDETGAETLVGGEGPADGEASSDDETPDDDETPVDGEGIADAEAPSDEEAPDGDETPDDGEEADEETPDDDEKAGDGETPDGEASSDEEAPDGDEEDGDGETPDGEALYVAVQFVTEPETAVVTVCPAAAEDAEEATAPEAVPPQEDGSFLLIPGDYTYTAEADGFASIVAMPFTVTEGDGPLTIAVALDALPEAAEPVAFEQSRTIGDVVVTVKAEPGVFPANAALSVTRVPVYRQRQAEAAIGDVRDEDANVAVSYTFDIKVIDPDTDEEIQPADGQSVEVSFALAEAADDNLETSVYHVTEDEDTGELTAQTLEAEVDADAETVTATTDGFSLYTVEFTYNTLQYVMQGGTSVALSEILEAVGLMGEAQAVSVSDAALLEVYLNGDAWYIRSLQAFSTKEWMKVAIDGITYQIAVTDAQGLTSGSTSWSGDLVVSSDLTIDQLDPGTKSRRVRLTGDATLEIKSGATLTVPWGIYVPKGRTLTITGGGILKAGSIHKEDGNASYPDEYCERYCAGIGGGWLNSDSASVTGQDSGNVVIDMASTGEVHAWGSHRFKTHTGSVQGGSAAGIGGAVKVISGQHGGQNGGNGGNITIKGGTVYAHGGEGAAGIGGGGFAGSDSTPGDSGTIKITGGTVYAYGDKDPKDKEPGGAGIGGGNGGIADITISGGTVTAQGGYLAAGIGGGYYADGGTINIGGTCTVTATAGEGYPVNGQPVFGGAGIGGGSDGNGGVITIGGSAKVTAYGTAGVSDAEMYNGDRFQGGAGIGGADTGSGGKITIKDSATVRATGGAGSAGIGGGIGVTDSVVYGGSGTIIISGGEVTANGGTGAAGIGGALYGKGESITVSGGKVTAKGIKGGAGIGGGGYAGGGTIAISGGIVSAASEGSFNSDLCGGAGIGGGYKGKGDDITISSGTVTAMGDEGGAGIGNGSQAKGSGKITISGGTITEAMGGVMGAGIGSGMSAQSSGIVNDCTIVVSGSAVITSAQGGSGGAGIGGGYDGSGGTITIKGGTIIAKGGNRVHYVGETIDSDIWGGAGIGGGMSGAGGTIVISGGNSIKAYGGTGGAGIGSGSSCGDDSSTDKITISGGTIVEAIGGASAAGIGSGDNSAAGTIEISGCSIAKAKGGDASTSNGKTKYGGAGIGGGYGKTGGTITIKSGTFGDILGGVGGAGIGGGTGGGGGGITISGGTFTLIRGGVGAAGIGGGVTGDGGGTIKITGGTIVKVQGSGDGTLSMATADSSIKIYGGAGIGGGFARGGGTITISGGEIREAVGGFGGAGIGGGDLGAGGSITIEDSALLGTVTGGTAAAGIGGGNTGRIEGTQLTVNPNTTGGTITIKGGTLTNISGGGKGDLENLTIYGGAGIGSGFGGQCGTITIEGGTVTVTGGYRSAGIGGGYNGGGGTISISGGVVNAVGGGNGAAGIGAGPDSSGGTNITLTWTDATKWTTAITASGYLGIVKTRARFYYVDGTDKKVVDASAPLPLRAEVIAAIANRTLRALIGNVINVDGSIQHGSVTANAFAAEAGTPVTLTIAPEEYYVLDHLTVTGATSGTVPTNQVDDTTYTFVMVDEDVTVTAGFAITYAVILPTDVPHGSVTADRARAKEGDTVTLTTRPDEGYYVRGPIVTSGGSTLVVEPGTVENTYIFTMPGDDAYVSVKFGNGKYHDVIVSTDIENGTVTADPTRAEEEDTVTLIVAPEEGYYLTELTVSQADGEDSMTIPVARVDRSTYTFVMGTGDAYVSATFGKLPEICYIDPTDAADPNKTCAIYTMWIDETELTDGWWVILDADILIGERVTVSGDVRLILCDYASLSAAAGITVADSGSLTVYAQSEGPDMGKLFAGTSDGTTTACAGNASGIGGGKAITINGGAVTANGGTHGAGIGGGSYAGAGMITINGGTVAAQGGASAPGIGGGYRGNGGKITIKGGTVTATGGPQGAGIGSGVGTYTAEYDASGTGCEIVIEGGTVTAKGKDGAAGIGGSMLSNAGTTTISGGTVTTTSGWYSAGIGGGEYGNCGTIVISGGDVTANGSSWGAGIGNGAYAKTSGGTITISGETTVVTANGGDYGAGIGSSYMGVSGKDMIRITIKGGTVTANGGIEAAGIGGSSYLYDESEETVDDDGACGGTIIIEGGTVTANGGMEAAGIGGGRYTIRSGQKPNEDFAGGASGGSITISGGKITAIGGFDGAGIGGGYGGLDLGKKSGSGGEITIKGGEITAANGYGSGAGIGGGNGGEGGTITIEGGIITATSGHGAGIGGGQSGYGGKITISGETTVITATGYKGGAGIGGGSIAESSGEITINGGKVTAASTSSTEYNKGAAGIGSGHRGECGTITINGGNVTATGDADGAGIGGDNGGTITINGGTVTATGNGSGAGIGSSGKQFWQKGGTITVNGGAVTATATGNAPGIGGRSVNDSDMVLGVTLTWTDDTREGMRVTASSYDGNVVLGNGFRSADESRLPFLATHPNSADQTSMDNMAGRTLIPAVLFAVTAENDPGSNGSVAADLTYAESGDVVTLSYFPDEGYWKTGVSVTDANGDPVTVTNDRFIMPNGEVYVKATFEPIPDGLLMLATLKASGNTALKLTWTPFTNADGYDVFFGRCGSKAGCTLLESVQGGDVAGLRITGLKKRKYYMAYVRPWINVGGAKTYINAQSPSVYAIAGKTDGVRSNTRRVIAKPKKTTIAQGRTVKIKVKASAVVSSKRLLKKVARFRYYSSDKSVATVSKSGKVKGVGLGSCTIYAIANDGVRASVTITVVNEPTKLKFGLSRYWVKKGKTRDLFKKLKLTPKGVKSASYTWTSSDPRIATVSAKGVVKGLKKGDVTITVTAANGKTAKVKVRIC